MVFVPVFLLDLRLEFLGVADFTDRLGLVVVTDHGLLTTQSQDSPKPFPVIDSRNNKVWFALHYFINAMQDCLRGTATHGKNAPFATVDLYSFFLDDPV